MTKTTTIDVCHEDCTLFIFCHDVCQKQDIIIYGRYRAYWCALPPNNTYGSDIGYLFGGIYTSKQQNPITGARSCPMSFYPLHFGKDMQVCVSNDIQSVSNSIPFGGFQSCTIGNPLDHHHQVSLKIKFILTDAHVNLTNFWQQLIKVVL